MTDVSDRIYFLPSPQPCVVCKQPTTAALKGSGPYCNQDLRIVTGHTTSPQAEQLWAEIKQETGFIEPADQPQDPSTKDEERSKAPVPVLDPVAYAGLLGEIVAAAAPTTEADPVGIYATLLAGVSVLIGDGPHVQVGNTRHPLLVWPLLFGRTGSGRKGESAESAELFLHLSSTGYREVRETGLSSGEGLIERIRDPDPDNPKDQGGTTDKRLLVLEPEFSTVMARAKREGSTLAGVLREAWAGKRLGVLNRRALKASSSHVAIVGHVTPREFRLRLAEADMAGGTFNRFLPLWVERARRLPIPEGIEAAIRDPLAKRLGEAIVDARKASKVQLDREATLLWTDELYDELTASDDEDQAWTEITRRPRRTACA